MKEYLAIENEILINATSDVIWDILVNPDKTKQYMYGCEVKCDWNPGDEILWIGSTDEVTYVKGRLVELDPEKRMVYTVIDPTGDYQDIPENYLSVSYDLIPEDNLIRLKVCQGDYSKVADGEKRYKDSAEAGGWQSVLEKIKEIAEVSSS